MNRAEYIQQIMEDSSRLKRLAMSDRSKLGSLQLSKAQLELVYVLYYHEKITVKQAARHLGVSVSAISQLSDSLHADGYLLRADDPKDRRIIYLSLSAKGHRIIKKLRKHLRSGFRATLETLDDRELASLKNIYKKMVANTGRVALDD